MSEKTNDGGPAMSTDLARDALRYLAHVYTKEAGQTAAGFRNTRQVAEYLQVKTPVARRALERLFNRGLIKGYVARPTDWRITSTGLARAKAEEATR